MPASDLDRGLRMSESLRPYPAYRDSGVAWLGEVPAHWGLIRTKTLLRERSQKGFPDEPLLAATQTKGVVRKEQYENRTVLALKDLHLLKLVRVGDFVISLRSFQGGIEYAREQGIISPAYTILSPVDRQNYGYLACLFKSKPFIENLTLFVTGIREGQNIDYEKLSRSPLPLPPLPEQSAIVRFLDHADRRLRRAVRAKRQLIALLNEQKQAIIHRAVTRGLDPDVPLKDSGVEWLGEVPAHWEIKALKRVLHQLIDCEHKTAPKVDFSEYRVIRTTAVRHGHLNLQGTYCTTAEGFDEWTCRGCPEPGDVVFTREAPAGEACVIPPGYKFCLGQRTVLMKVRKDHYDSQYLVHIIDVGPPRHFIKLASQGSTVSHFNIEDIAILPVLVPPFEEQIAIVNHLEKVTRSMDNEVQNTQHEIDLLLEFRTRLIADVVTGKIDVREAAAGLPDEAEEPARFDEFEVPDDEEQDASGDPDVDPEGILS